MSLIFQKPPFNYQYKVGIANLIDVEVADVTATGNTGGDALLQDIMIPGGVFAVDGQKVSYFAFGTKQQPGGSLTLGIKFNGVNVFTFSSITTAALVAWKMEGEWERRGSDLLLHSKSEYNYDNGVSGLASPTLRGNRVVQSGVNFAQAITVAAFANIPTVGDTVTQNYSHVSVL